MLPSIESFWKGSDEEDRRKSAQVEYLARKTELEANAADLHTRICAVITMFESLRGDRLPGVYSSGWRPKKVNEATANSGKASAHLDANAGDVKDTPEGKFAWWCFHNQQILAQKGLWMEHPVATVLMAKATPWCHLSRVPPKSGTRAYFPNAEAAKVWQEHLASGGKAEGGPKEVK